MSLSHRPVDRIMRKAGAERVSEAAARELAHILEDKAIEISKVCYSIHKAGEKNRTFFKNFVNNLNATVSDIIPLKIYLQQIYYFQKKEKIEVLIDLYRIIS